MQPYATHWLWSKWLIARCETNFFVLSCLGRVLARWLSSMNQLTPSPLTHPLNFNLCLVVYLEPTKLFESIWGIQEDKHLKKLLWSNCSSAHRPSFRAHYYQATSFAGGATGAGTACQELWSHRSKLTNVDRCVTNFTNEIQMRLIEKT